MNGGSGVWLFAATTLLAVPSLYAQGLRGEIGVTAGLVEFRDVVRESTAESLVPGTGIVRTLPDGTVVTCIPGGDCYWYRGGTVQQAHPITQDIDLVAWPGMRGVAARLQVRGRYGSNALWPRSRQEIALVAAWVDFERTSFRIRAGRQERRGGVATEVFDGGAVLWRPGAHWRFEGFVGRSLADALLQPRTGFLLHDADELAPDESSALWGLESRYHAGRAFAAGLTYQRNLRLDRVALYAERLAFDAWWKWHAILAETSADYDLATGDFNEARIRVQGPASRGLHVAGEVRHREPFFELWTIWGAFAPVAFDEARLEGWWNPAPTLRLDAMTSYRNYGETHTGMPAAPIEGDGWRAQAGVDWMRAGWRSQGIYRLHWGFGSYRSTFDAVVQRALGLDTTLGFFGTATQQFMEFRFGDGRTWGGGCDVAVDRRATRLRASVGWYRHTFQNRPGFEDYGQWRASLDASFRFATGVNADGARSRPATLRWPQVSAATRNSQEPTGE